MGTVNSKAFLLDKEDTAYARVSRHAVCQEGIDEGVEKGAEGVEEPASRYLASAAAPSLLVNAYTCIALCLLLPMSYLPVASPCACRFPSPICALP